MKLTIRRLSGLTLAGCLLLSQGGCARRSAAVDAEEVAVGAQPVAAPGQPVAPPSANAGDPFKFPADKGGELLSQLLRPGTHSMAEDGAREKLHLAPPRSVAYPEIPFSAAPSFPPEPPAPKKPTVRPRTLAEDAPLSAYRDDPLPPAHRDLTAGARISLASIDVSTPVPLGYLGTLQPDRVPLDDPSTVSSQNAVLAAGAPARTEVVPFTPINLPDPFQNAQTIRLRTPPKEEGEPTGTHPKLPPAPMPPAPAK